MGSNLAQIFRIRKMLRRIKYPDSLRISREIVKFLEGNKSKKEEDILKRLYKNEPWEYVCGIADFCGMDFIVNTHTLIPRIETEKVVSDSLEIIKELDIKNIIDVGTGSGCIIISIAKELKTDKLYSMHGIDISKRALKIARKNEKKLLEKKRIKWISSDLIKKLPRVKGSTLLIANLPYIPTQEYEKLDDSVKKYEPKLALDGGENGLDMYKRLFKQIEEKKLLLKAMYLETDERTFEDTLSLIKKHFPKAEVNKFKDCFDKYRFIKVLF